jgi:hypothetical protein
MSKPTGKRFSDREETQKGSKDSRAVTKEGLTNKNDKLPSGKADFMKDLKRDISKALQDVDAPDKKGKPVTGAARANRIEGKSRGQSRLGGTAGAVGTALSVGYTAGRVIGNLGGDDVVRKGIDKSGLGEKIDKAATGDRVELSKESKARIAAGDLEKGKDERVNKKDFPTYKKDTKSAEAFRKEFKDAKESGKDSFGFEGREYNTKDKDMNKGGMVKYAKGGMVKANCGASVPPAQKAKK